MRLPLSDLMTCRNGKYYKSESTKIHSDFSTYAQDAKGAFVEACATGFYAANSGEDEEEKPLRVLEAGIGEANFALGFLQAVERLDKKNGTDLSERLRYSLADFSDALLSRAQKKLEAAGFLHAECIKFDASSDELPSAIRSASYGKIFCHELLSDVPAGMFCREGKTIFEVQYSEKLDGKITGNYSAGPLGDAMLSALPEGYFVPVNREAARAAIMLAETLDANASMDIFDYGFYFAEDFLLPSEMWNMGMVREYGGQITVDLNFIFLSASLHAAGFSCSVERQKGYVERMLGKKLGLKQGRKGLGYSQRKAGQGSSGKAGLGRSAGNGVDFDEDDSFYHMRVQR